ncbi:MAG: hypothetical protein IPL86_17540 [Flavobacteriales bacterium]|nr:hypothetical protein [Flavobacteriales bacterium]
MSEGEGGNSIDESGVLNVNADGTINCGNRLKTTSIAFTSQLAAVADGYLIVVDSYNGSVAFERTAPVHGLSDWWVVRLDLSGNIMWDKAFGNEGNDYAVSILPKPDGGFLIAGRVEDRPEPGPTNDVTEASRGFADLWVVRTDAWRQSLG